jgi:ribosomal protein S6
MGSLSKIIGVTRQAPQPENEAMAEDISSIPLTTPIHENEEALVLSAEDVQPNWAPNPSADWSHNQYEVEDDVIDIKSVSNWRQRATPIFLSGLLLVWTAFFLWSTRAELLQIPTSMRGIQLLGAWSLPAGLIGIFWLLMLRNSTSESRRFAKTALLLREESAVLEARVRNINDEIAMARGFLVQHGQDLENVGRQSSSRMIEAANLLGVALHDSEEKAKALEVVSTAATGNLEQLRKHLPVVTSAAKDVTNQIGNAGNAAQLEVKSLIDALKHVSVAGSEVRENIGDIEAKAATMADNLTANVNRATEALSATTQTALSKSNEIASNVDAMAERLEGAVTKASGEIVELTKTSNTQLEQHISALRSGIAMMAQATSEQDATISSIVERLQSNVEKCGEKIAQIDEMATDRSSKLAFSLETLAVSSHDLNGSLANNSKNVEALLATSERLLLALDTSGREIEETLPAALSRIDAHFERSLALLAVAQEQTVAVENHGAQMFAKSEELMNAANANRSHVEALLAESDAQFLFRREQAENLTSSLRETKELLADLSTGASEDVVQALQNVKMQTQAAADESKKILDTELADVSAKMAEQSRSILADAVNAQVNSLNTMIENAIGNNISVSKETTEQLVTQIAQIESMTSNLEARIHQNREHFEGLDNDGFSRRMALLTESLNSTAIDVAKILSNEVTDTSWASYLKGDRGVFTRRAVKLLDAGEARAIAAHYGDDPEFREHVNRYIHDFESMMRVLLSTRDGNAIGVTLLSSDVGKLYVALAQAIERLRN